jgi:hypothetical protein
MDCWLAKYLQCDAFPAPSLGAGSSRRSSSPYPVGGYSPADPLHTRDVDRRWIAWLAKYLQ